MKVWIILLITLHAAIHAFGFIKAFNIARFDAITQPVSKPIGILWLTVGILFFLYVVLISEDSNIRWIVGLAAVIGSQYLIISYWGDAKFGTIINVVILIHLVVSYAAFSFQSKIKEERQQLLSNVHPIHQDTISESSLNNLPTPVRKWLKVCGVVNRPPISSVSLKQHLQLKMKEDQKEWYDASANQYFSVYPPAFNWSIHMGINPIMKFVGRDQFVNGKGAMVIKLFSIIPIAIAKDDPKIDQASLQRYLAEMVWFPTAATAPYISWEAIDAQSAKATMTVNGTIGSGIFHFNEEGHFVKFTAERYRDVQDVHPSLWTVSALHHENHNGIMIPTECEVSWTTDQKQWTWLKLEIADVSYSFHP